MPTKSKPATQDFVPVRDIKENVVVLKDGKMCTVLLASSINFALKSAEEQQAILSQFQSFLNTIDLSIQFYVQSRRLDITPYLAQLEARETVQDNDLMRIQVREYIQFIRTFTTEVDIMSKNFFIIIPYTPAGANLASGISSVFGSKKGKVAFNEKQFEEYRIQLEQRATLVEQGLIRIGVRTVPLQNEELVELFYHIFNPSDTTGDAPRIN